MLLQTGFLGTSIFKDLLYEQKELSRSRYNGKRELPETKIKLTITN